MVSESIHSSVKDLLESVDETLISRKDVRKILKVSNSTLWRWAKIKYLEPTRIGGRRYYKVLDIKKIATGGATKNEQ